MTCSSLQVIDSAADNDYGGILSRYLFGPVATTPTGPEAFGLNLQRLRKRGGFLRAKELAKVLKIGAPKLSRMEKGNQGLPEAPTLLRIAKTVKCSIEELMENVDPDYDKIVATWAVTARNKDQATSTGEPDAQAGLLATAHAERDKHRTPLDRAEDAALELLHLIAAAKEDVATRKGAAHRSGARRKTG